MISNYDKEKFRIYSIIIAFTGMVCFIFSFVGKFAVKEDPFVLAFVCLLAIVGGSFGNKKSNIAVLIIAVVYTLINFTQLKYGLAVFVNSMSDSIGSYFNTDTYYLLADNMSVMMGQGSFVFPFMILMSYYMGYSYANRKVMWLYAIVIFATFIFCIVIEVIPSGLIITLNFVYLIMVMVTENAGRIKKGNIAEHGTTLVASLISGGIVLVVLLMSMFVNPESTYVRPDLAAKYGDTALAIYKRIQGFDMYGIWDELVNNIPSSIGGGNIGDMDTVKYADKTVLNVRVPDVRPTIYLKAYVGSEYSSTQWYKVDTDGYEDLFYMLDNDWFHTQDMVVELLKTMVDENINVVDFSTFGMTVNKEDATTKFGYIPTFAYIDPSEYGMANDQAVYSEKQEYSYYLYYDINNKIIPQLEEYVESSDNEMIQDFRDYEEAYRGFVYDKYLDVNTPMADELYQEWGNYSSETAEDRLTTAAAIKKYLSTTCSYTLSPGRVPSDEDFVEYFLNETREGYCTYFATAGVMMLRSAGIPARYVEGYMLKSSATGEETEFYNNMVNSYSSESSGYYNADYEEVDVLDSNGHAWVEFYIDGIGWIPYEMTPGNGTSSYSGEDETTRQVETIPNTEKETTTNNEEETTTRKQQGNNNQNETTSETVIDDNNGSSFSIDFDIVFMVLKILGIIAAVFLVGGAIYFRHKLLEIRYKSLYNSDEPNSTKILALYKHFEKLMAFQGFKKSKFLQPVDFAKDIESRCKLVDQGEITELMAIFQKASYSDIEMTREEFTFVYDTMGVIRDRLYNSLGILRKIWFVFFLNL